MMEHVHEGGCPGSKMMQFKATQEESTLEQSQTYMKPVSRLGQWPCQILPDKAPAYRGTVL